MRIQLTVCVLVWMSVSADVSAQLVTEQIPLHSGWNAVWIDLEPEPNDLQLILAQQPAPTQFQSFWTFQNVGDTSVFDFGADAGRWFHFDKSVPPEVNTLRFLHGHRGYLIKMNSNGQLALS